MAALPVNSNRPFASSITLALALAAACLLCPGASAQTPAAASAEAQRAAGEAEPFTGAFSNGVKVELVGLSHHPALGQPWWTPDGMLMRDPPYAPTATPLQPAEGERLIEISWRWVGLPPAEIQNAKWEFSPILKPSQDFVPTGPDGARLADLRATVVTVSAREDDFTIRFSLPVRGAGGPNPAREVVEFRGGSLYPRVYERLSVYRVSPDGKEERLPAAGATKALTEMQLNSPEYKANQERYQKELALEKALGEEPKYRLKDGERFKHAPPPFSKARQDYWVMVTSTPGREPDPNRPGFMLFQSVDGSVDWKSASGSSSTIGRLLDEIFNIKSHRVEGGQSLLSTELPGDWILSWDPNAATTGDPKASHVTTSEDIEAFERIVQDELIEVVDFELREVARPVYVVKGTYKYTPIPDPDGKMRARRSDFPDEIKLIAGSRRVSGSFPNFPEALERIGEFLKIPLVDETTTKPAKRQTQITIFGPPPAEAKPLDQAAIDAALASLTEQTGYTFTKDERPVKMLFIKRGGRD